MKKYIHLIWKDLFIRKMWITLIILVLTGSVTLGQNINVRTDTWKFDNFDTPSLTWADFRETYYGIAASKSESANFDGVFFDLVYEKLLAGKGNCFGMCLLAAKMKTDGGCQGYCYPPYIYPGTFNDIGNDTIGPSDNALRHAINIMQGHQLNHNVVMYIIEQFARRGARDGRNALDQFKACLSKNEPCVLSITKSLNPRDGVHSLLPYDIEQKSSTETRLYVYDPNVSYYEPNASGSQAGPTYYNKQCYVKINQSNGEWEMKKSFIVDDGNTETWGNTLTGIDNSTGENIFTGGTILLFPLSVIGPKDRLPQSILGDLNDAINKILVYGSGADISQITSKEGKHLFKPGTRELETDKDFALEGIYPFFYFNEAAPGSDAIPCLYFSRLVNEDLTIDVSNGGKGYNLAMIGCKGAMVINANGGKGNAKINLKNFDTPNPEVNFKNQKRISSCNVELQTIIKSDEKVKIYTIEHFKPRKKSPVNIKLTSSGEEIEIQSTKRIKSLDLSISERGKTVKQPTQTTFKLKKKKPVRFIQNYQGEIEVINIKSVK